MESIRALDTNDLSHDHLVEFSHANCVADILPPGPSSAKCALHSAVLCDVRMVKAESALDPFCGLVNELLDHLDLLTFSI